MVRGFVIWLARDQRNRRFILEYMLEFSMNRIEMTTSRRQKGIRIIDEPSEMQERVPNTWTPDSHRS